VVGRKGRRNLRQIIGDLFICLVTASAIAQRHTSLLEKDYKCEESGTLVTATFSFFLLSKTKTEKKKKKKEPSV